MYLEMFLWTSKKGIKAFGLKSKEFAEETKVLAANQGLYNGFLAAGLIWSFFISDSLWATNVAIFFLACVSVAGVYGGFSVSKKIFFVQGMPAIIAIALWIVFSYSLV